MSAFDEINSVSNIKDIYEIYTGHNLKKTGSDWTGLCPFHQDKTAGNFRIRKGRYYKCFACGEFGGVVDLTQKLFGITDKLEALEKLNRDFALGLKINNSDKNTSKIIETKHKELREYKNFLEWRNTWFRILCDEYHAIRKSLRHDLMSDDLFWSLVERQGELDWITDVMAYYKGSRNDYKQSELYKLKKYVERDNQSLVRGFSWKQQNYTKNL